MFSWKAQAIFHSPWNPMQVHGGPVPERLHSFGICVHALPEQRVFESGREKMRIYYPYLLFRNLRSSSAPCDSGSAKIFPTAAAIAAASQACVLSRRGANNSLLERTLCIHFSAAPHANQRQLCDTHRSRVHQGRKQGEREQKQALCRLQIQWFIILYWIYAQMKKEKII